MERALTGRSIGSFFLGDPDAEILVRAEDLNACGLAERSNMEGLADKERAKGNPMVIDLIWPAVKASS